MKIEDRVFIVTFLNGRTFRCANGIIAIRIGKFFMGFATKKAMGRCEK
jgi:hypothetical protein